jgi:hypothetical protein
MRRCSGASAAPQCCTPPARPRAHAFRSGAPLQERAAAPHRRGPRRTRRAPHQPALAAAGWLPQPSRVVIRRVRLLRAVARAPGRKRALGGNARAHAIIFAAAATV